MARDELLAVFLRGMLSGTADIGLSLLPLIGMYKAAKADPAWKRAGLIEWITNDPQAAPLLAEALTKARERLPEPARMSLILALGGTP